MNNGERRSRDEAVAAVATWDMVEASNGRHFDIARALFQEYASGLGVDLCFQNFVAELDDLPRMYGPPMGCLLLGMDGETPAGCAGLRQLSARVCEMKRLYVRRECRGGGRGRRLAERLVGKARALGYATMRLDTLDDMLPALQLYGSLGFKRIPAYYDNPLLNSIYMELTL